MTDFQVLKELISEIKFRYNRKQYQIAGDLGVTATYFSDMVNGRVPVTESIISNIYELYSDVDKKYLSSFEFVKDEILEEEEEKSSLPLATYTANPHEGVPLIPLNAMAGVAQGEVSVLELECERYVIPMFKNADFLITVSGSSMYPKYNSGDIVACKKLSLQDVFFQWNKVYVLDTDQGALIKRIHKGSDKEHILLVSDNENYPAFEVKISHIYAIALVIGVVRME